jgi:hypothetical protein
VRLLEDVDESVVVAAFLRAELDSERFADELRDALKAAGRDETLITEPDLENADDNAARNAVLEAYRGGYLGAWFHEAEWMRAELEPAEVLDVRYIAWDFWLELTEGSRLPADGAARFRAGGTFLSYVHAAPLIVIRAGPRDHLVVVEGHVRLTALAMSPDTIPAPLEVLLGETESVRRWGCY